MSNENRDELGRYASGDGGGPKGATSKGGSQRGSSKRAKEDAELAQIRREVATRNDNFKRLDAATSGTVGFGTRVAVGSKAGMAMARTLNAVRPMTEDEREGRAVYDPFSKKPRK